jgi:hypothetical protein
MPGVDSEGDRAKELKVKLEECSVREMTTRAVFV